MAGSLTIPNVINTQPTGNLQGSVLDANWNQIRDYVNAREIASGTLAARPAAGTAGRWYFATNVFQLYFDTGTSWITVSSPDGYAVRNLIGNNTPATPNTKYDFSADLVVLRAPGDGSTFVFANTGTLTCNLGVVGANGLDAGTQAASTWYHFYFIEKSDGSTLASLASLVAPPTGPTLPTGYIYWAYAGAVRSDAGTSLVKTRMRGTWMVYEVAQNALNSGTAATETAVSVTTLIPPNNLMMRLHCQMNVAGAALAQLVAKIRYVAGSDFYTMIVNLQVVNVTIDDSTMLDIPGLSQQFLYLITGTFNAGGLTADVMGYSVPNGGE